MTDFLLAGTLSREFGGRSQAAVFQHFQRKQSEERVRRDRDDRADDKKSDFLDVASIVSEAELSTFRLEIDRYDTATIEALYANETALALILQQKEELFMQAHVLADGRRVFKSEDGVRVFDEFGEELDASTIDPDEIDNARPYWEAYEPKLAEELRLIEERQELLDYQTQLDEARERLDAGDLTQDEFEALRDDLTTAMPDAVRAHIPELAAEQDPVNDMAERQPIALDLSDDMRPTAMAPAMSAPGLSN